VKYLYQFYLFILFIIYFSGVLSLSIGVSAGLSGCTTLAYNTAESINTKLTLGTQVSDQVIKYKALYKLHQMTYAPSKNHVDLVVYDSRLVLLGKVQNQNIRNQIDQNLASIPGVYRVDDYLEIGKHSWVDWAWDAGLTAQVKSRVLLSSANHFHYDIHTDEGVVYLFGKAPVSEEKYIVSKIRVLPGVKKVVTIFPRLYSHKAPIFNVVPVALET